MHVRIDKKVGGYEHRFDRPDVFAVLLSLCSHECCVTTRVPPIKIDEADVTISAPAASIIV